LSKKSRSTQSEGVEVRGNRRSHHLLGRILHKTTTTDVCCTEHQYFPQLLRKTQITVLNNLTLNEACMDNGFLNLFSVLFFFLFVFLEF
jgi:hypothetical protein